jgi:hypothetical protein
MKFHKGEEWVFAFLLVKFGGVLFWYFEVLEFSIFFLSFWRFHMGGNNVEEMF